jgi:hypothetical protein
MMQDLLSFAARLLVLGGRLVYWLPTTLDYSDQDLPKHPCLRLRANSEQVLSFKLSRRLITMEKVCSYTTEQLHLDDQQRLAMWAALPEQTSAGTASAATDLDIGTQPAHAQYAKVWKGALTPKRYEQRLGESVAVAESPPPVSQEHPVGKRARTKHERRQMKEAWRREKTAAVHGTADPLIKS